MYPNQIYSVPLMKKRMTPDIREINTIQVSPNFDQSNLIYLIASTARAPNKAVPDST